jgi:3-phosphoglycerate kinase
MGLDVGPETRELFRSAVLEAKTILWNGYLRFQLTRHPTS